MLKVLAIGLLGATASIGGVWLNQHVKQQSEAAAIAEVSENKPLQVKTEITGIPIVSDGRISGYLIFQVNSTIDASKLPARDFNVLPYLLDAAIRASYVSTGDGNLKFDAGFLRKLCLLIQDEANKKLDVAAVVAVNLEQFNFVPKEDIRGSIFSGGHK